MFSISNLSDAAFQTASVQMPDGTTGTLNLYYRSSTPRWFFDFLHPQFANGGVEGQGLTACPNLLRQWQNQIDFGMACATLDGQDPVGSEDFVDGYATLYILAASDILVVEASVYKNVLARAAAAAQGLV
jgi:hypothetical protein